MQVSTPLYKWKFSLALIFLFFGYPFLIQIIIMIIILHNYKYICIIINDNDHSVLTRIYRFVVLTSHCNSVIIYVSKDVTYVLTYEPLIRSREAGKVT